MDIKELNIAVLGNSKRVAFLFNGGVKWEIKDRRIKINTTSK